MNTVIVPVDFSDTSLNAAVYAVKLLSGHSGIEIILYHFYEDKDEVDVVDRSLSNLKTDLLQMGTVDITTLSEIGDDFLAELEKLSRHRQADLVIMGITGRSAIGQLFMGSNALKMADNKFVPVMIIPPNSSYKEINNVLLTSDLKNVISTTPSGPIKKMLKMFQPNLHVINVNEQHYISLSEHDSTEIQKLKEMFSEFNPEFYFLNLFEIEEAINQFANDKNIDLIINIQREHSVLRRLFKSSHTKSLAYQSTVPVMVVHE